MKMRNLILPMAVAANLFAGGAQAADLGIVATGPTLLTVGVASTFTLTVTDYVFPLPPVQTKVVASGTANVGTPSQTGPAPWSCTGTTCTRSTAIAVGSSFPATTVMVTPTAAGPFKVCGSVSFTPNASTQPDQNAANDQNCVQGQVKPGAPKPPDLAIKKSIVGTPAFPGSAIFILQPVNLGPGVVNAGQAKVTDNLDPAAFSAPVIFLTSAGWNCGATVGLAVSCTNTTAVNASTPFPQIKFQVKTRHKGSFKNKAGIAFLPAAGQSGETVLNNNSATIGFTIN